MRGFASDNYAGVHPDVLAAIAEANVDHAVSYGDDPWTEALRARVHAELGPDADLHLVFNGTAANVLAIEALTQPWEAVICAASSHLHADECGAPERAGRKLLTVPAPGGRLEPAALDGLIVRIGDPHAIQPRVVSVTQSTELGTRYPVAALRELAEWAHGRGLLLHLDGARLFNAAAFLETSVSEFCRSVDSLWFALCKGLGGPVGAILAGDAAFMLKARRAARMLGGGMRQAGLLAAPAIVALQDPYPGHRRDNALARRLADGLAALSPGLTDGDVQTNIVNCFLDDAADIARALGERGVLTLAKGHRIRFVTHAQVDEASVEAAVAALADILSMHRKRRAHA
jgi:threonine aldolase